MIQRRRPESVRSDEQKNSSPARRRERPKKTNLDTQNCCGALTVHCLATKRAQRERQGPMSGA